MSRTFVLIRDEGKHYLWSSDVGPGTFLSGIVTETKFGERFRRFDFEFTTKDKDLTQDEIMEILGRVGELGKDNSLIGKRITFGPDTPCGGRSHHCAQGMIEVA